jgi:hypothetical protein
MDQFKKLYTELTVQLKGCFPKLTVNMPDYSTYSDANFLTDFVELNLPYIDDISIRNADAFLNKHKANLVRGVSFKKVLKLSPPDLIDAIFNYLRDLYVTGASVKEGVYLEISRKINDQFNEDRMLAVGAHASLMSNFLNTAPPDMEAPEGDDAECSEDDDGGEGINPLNMFADLENSEIGKFAKDLCSGMPEEEAQYLDQMAREGLSNPSDLFTKMFGAVQSSVSAETQGTEATAAASPAQDPLQNLIKRTVSTVQQKIDSGEINVENMMGSIQKMMSQMGGKFPFPGMPGMQPGRGSGSRNVKSRRGKGGK